MQISNSKLESSLVSMAGTLIYLREMTGTLLKKPVVPRAVAPLMSKTERELAVLEVQFEATRRAAVIDSQAYLDEWLRRTGLQVGGVFRGYTERASLPGPKLSVTGGIESARLHSYLVSGIRVVDIALAEAKIVFPRGGGSCVADIPVGEQASLNLVALHDVEVRDHAGGLPTKVLHVRVPLQGSERTRWASRGLLVL